MGLWFEWWMGVVVDGLMVSRAIEVEGVSVVLCVKVIMKIYMDGLH